MKTETERIFSNLTFGTELEYENITRNDAGCAKYDMRVRMIKLDLIGAEFENVRMHLTKRLTGNSRNSTRRTLAQRVA